MISFRYHLASLLAVLLALATGIAVGSAALGTAATPTPTAAPAAPSTRALDDFARAATPKLVRGTLTDERVLLVLAPDAPAALADALQDQLELAGGTVAGRLRLDGTLLDTGESATVDDVVAAVLPEDLALPETTALDRAAAELGSVLLTTGGKDADDDVRDSVLGGFSGADLLDVEKAPSRGATSLLVVTGPGRTARSTQLAALVGALEGPRLVVGPVAAAATGGVLSAVRSDSAVSARVSTVDGADTAAGQVAVVLALAEQVDGDVGQYGRAAGAQRALPDLR